MRSTSSQEAVLRAVLSADHAMQCHLVAHNETPVRVVLADGMTDSAKRRVLQHTSPHLSNVRIVTDDGRDVREGDVVWVEDELTGQRQRMEVMEHAQTQSRHVLRPNTALYSDDEEDADDDYTIGDWVPQTLRRRRSHSSDNQIRRRLPSVPHLSDDLSTVESAGRPLIKRRKLPGFKSPWTELSDDGSHLDTTSSTFLNTMNFADDTATTVVAEQSTRGLCATRDKLPQPTYLREYQQYIESFDGTASTQLKEAVPNRTYEKSGKAGNTGTQFAQDCKNAASKHLVASVVDNLTSTSVLYAWTDQEQHSMDTTHVHKDVMTQTPSVIDKRQSTQITKMQDFSQQTLTDHSTQTPLRIQPSDDSANQTNTGSLALADTFGVDSKHKEHVIEPWDLMALKDLCISSKRDFATQTFGQVYQHCHCHVQTQTKLLDTEPKHVDSSTQPMQMSVVTKVKEVPIKEVPVQIKMANPIADIADKCDIFDVKLAKIKHEKKKDNKPDASKSKKKEDNVSKSELLKFMLKQVRELKSQLESEQTSPAKTCKKDKQKKNHERKANGLLEDLSESLADEQLYTKRRLELMYKTGNEKPTKANANIRHRDYKRAQDDLYTGRRQDRYPILPRRAMTPPPPPRSAWQPPTYHRQQQPMRQARFDPRFAGPSRPPVGFAPQIAPMNVMRYGPPVHLGPGAFRPVSAGSTPMHIMPVRATTPMQTAPIVFVPSEQVATPCGIQPHQPYVVVASPHRYDSESTYEMKEKRTRAQPRKMERSASARTPRSLEKSILKATQAATEMKGITDSLKVKST